MLDAGGFIDLFVASYMILLLCASVNVSSLTFINWLETIQSIISLLVFAYLIAFPLLLIRFYMKNL